jgi:dTMP kinase
MDGLTEFFLFLAQRRDIRKTLIEPALLRGETVISDRSDSSTFAFQIYGRHQHDLLPLFRETRNLLSPLPDLYIILDVPTEVAQARLAARQRRAGDFDRIDSESIEFHERVRQGFLQLKSEVACPCIFIDATRPPSEVAIDVVSEVAHFLRERLS